MPVVSDFNVIDKNDFVTASGGTYSRSFNTSGRHNSNALLDIAVLGGFRSGDAGQNMSVRVRVNGTSITSFITNRWATHATIVYDRVSAVIDAGILRSGNNTLELIPTWEASNDYMFLGAVVCHFHQAA